MNVSKRYENERRYKVTKGICNMVFSTYIDYIVVESTS